MPKYKIVTGEPVSDESSDPIVEVRLNKNDGFNASLQGRNPRGAWHTILFLDSRGRAGKQFVRGKITGLLTDDEGYIVTY